MKKEKIKLIIIDFYGVMTLGSYRDTCRWLSKKYKLNYDYLYKIFYHKYFSKAVLGKISERKSFELPLKEFGFDLEWKKLRKKHLSFQKMNWQVFRFSQNLQKQGYPVLILTMNTKQQFKETIEKYNVKKYFKNIINTYNLRLPKSSPKTMRYVLKKFRVLSQEVIMVDDQDFNLVAAKKMGVKTILYKDFQNLKKIFKMYL